MISYIYHYPCDCAKCCNYYNEPLPPSFVCESCKISCSPEVTLIKKGRFFSRVKFKGDLNSKLVLSSRIEVVSTE